MLTLINGEKLIVREELSEVLERILAYRATLLAAVARRLAPSDALVRAASLSSLDVKEVSASGDLSQDAQREDEAR
jgi:hypothetical protein